MVISDGIVCRTPYTSTTVFRVGIHSSLRTVKCNQDIFLNELTNWLSCRNIPEDWQLPEEVFALFQESRDARHVDGLSFGPPP